MRGQSHSVNRQGFTLVEIMIVVVIVGLLAAMAIPAFQRVRESSQNTVVMNGFRVIGGAFANFELENGYYPDDVLAATLPPEMEGYLPEGTFTKEKPMGGYWNWEMGVLGIVAGVSVEDHNATTEQLLRLDDRMDDGNLSSGVVQHRSGRLLYIIEE